MLLPAVEILSSNRADDLVVKSARYADAGLPHCRVVDPRDRTLSAYDLAEGRYRRQAHLALPPGPDGHAAGRLRAGLVEVDVDLARLLGR